MRPRNGSESRTYVIRTEICSYVLLSTFDRCQGAYRQRVRRPLSVGPLDLRIRVDAWISRANHKGPISFIRKLSDEPVSMAVAIPQGFHGGHRWAVYREQEKGRISLKGELQTQSGDIAPWKALAEALSLDPCPGHPKKFHLEVIWSDRSRAKAQAMIACAGDL
jgi:hypothetical protein